MVTTSSKPAFTVAVSGVPGSGKSTLIGEAAAALGQAVTLFFDDYGGTSLYPEDLKSWVSSGGAPDDWQTPQLVQDLEALRAGISISHPRSQILITPQPVILIEEPFGRSREKMNPLVDLAVFIRLPFDIAIVRVIRRMLLEDENHVESERQGCTRVVEGFFHLYLENGMREMFEYTEEVASRSADIVLDGTQASRDLMGELLEAIQVRSKSY